MKGFKLYYKRKDLFFETELKNKTDNLAKKIIRAMVNSGYDIPDNPDVRKEILYYLRKAECKIEPLANGKQLIRIYGDDFSICDIMPSEKTVIIKL